MATTSLAAQLQQLAIPQATAIKEDVANVRTSLLFNPKEAALKDRDTFLAIGLNGLKELKSLYEGFKVFEDSLFSDESRDFERSVQTEEVNDNLDQTIEKFLIQLSPYILLQPAHQALEWLINRYHIHEYNVHVLVLAILPYHNTMIFVRIVQLLKLHPQQHRMWNFLNTVRKKGAPLTLDFLCPILGIHGGLSNHLCKHVQRSVELFGDRATQLNTLFVFICQLIMRSVQLRCKRLTDSINKLLPLYIQAIGSPISEFRAMSYISLGYIFTNMTIDESTLDKILESLLTTEFDLSYDATLLIIILYQSQTHYERMDKMILNLSTDIMYTMCGHLKSLIERKNDANKLVCAILSSTLERIQKGSEEFFTHSNIPDIMIEELDLKDQSPEKIIACILECYSPKRDKKASVQENENGSDLEIIEDENEAPVDEHFNTKIYNWYAAFIKKLEKLYPGPFDSTLKMIMQKHKGKSVIKRNLNKLLGFKPQISHEVSGSYLFENINHVNPHIRTQAIVYVNKNFDKILEADAGFVRGAITSRLADDHPDVVKATLKIPDTKMLEVLNEIDLTDCLVKICSRREKTWMPIIKHAIEKFCSLAIMPVNQETLLCLLPYLFPEDKEAANIARVILESNVGERLKLKGKIKDSAKDNFAKIKNQVFQILFKDKSVDFSDLFDENILNKKNTRDICLFLLLKSCNFDKVSIEEIADTLNLLLESVETRSIVMSAEGKPFSSEIMAEFFKEARMDNMLFEIIQYLFIRVIEDMNIKKISKPWCNVCKTSEMTLIRKLYEICITGCAIPSYSNHYLILLQKLLNKFCKNPRDKFEFIANFAYGHIFYAADPKDVIGPELQLRSLKLLSNFVTVQIDSDWLYESDVVMLMSLFSLNNPVAVIRERVMDIVTKLSEGNEDKSNAYVYLLHELHEHKEELLMDPNQITQVLNTIFTAKDPQSKVFRKNCLTKLTSVLNSNAPSHIKSSLLKIFEKCNNATTFPLLLPALKNLEEDLKENIMNEKFTLDIYESNTFIRVYSHINESTITTFDKEEIWSSIKIGMKEYRDCVILQENQTFTSPAVLIMKQIDEDVFKKLPDTKRVELVRLITLAGVVSNNATISSAASKLIKKIHVSYLDFKTILESMLHVQEAENPPKKKKSTVSLLSYQLTETDEWRLGVAVLEYVQNKKKLQLDNTFVTMMFDLLNKCLRFEEQSYVEYPKQLILSSLWFYCKKFVKETDKTVLNSVTSVFKVELIVQCIRGTQNPQTHHHALILLSHAAYLLPEQVLHHTMEIFTFVGSSVLRHDDAYSFQIISRIIETLIPILVKLDKGDGKQSVKQHAQLQKRVVPVLRIFADVVLHVPEHRRLPLYKKLMETIGASQFLWVLIALLLEAHVTHFDEIKKKNKTKNRALADQEDPINRIDFGQSILLEFPPEIGLQNFIKLILHIKSLPMQKEEDAMESDTDPSEVFCVNGHTPTQLRHYKYACIRFMNTCLASSRFIQHNSSAKKIKLMEANYKTLIINTLTFIQAISKVTDEKTAKYWRVMLHHSYDLLDHTNNMLSAPMFLNVIRGLLKHTLHTVRRKSMELLNSKIQNSPEFLADVDKKLLFSLLEPLLEIIETIEKEEKLTGPAAQELELNQQTALLSLKLLTRMLAAENPEPFKAVLEKVTDYTCNSNISGNVMASVVLCLAELCSNLRAYALVGLRRFMPALIKVLKKQRKAETPELVLLSTVTAIAKIVESMPMFLSPYLQKILIEYAILYGKWQASDQESGVVTKLSYIKKKIATAIPPRVLIPVVSNTHKALLAKEHFDAIGPAMSVLADSFTNVTAADFTALQQDLTTFFLNALQLRSELTDKAIDTAIIDNAEDEVVNALVSLVLKLSETSFRPFYFKIYDWAIRSNVDGQKERVITFYRLSSAIAEKLKGLYVLFAGHFVKNAADMLDSCNNSKTEDLYYDTEEKCICLIKYIIKTLHIVFLYDSQSFINKDRFETLMQPIVDQFENTVGGIPSLKSRAEEFIIPCVAQFAVAIADDSLWKLLNYQILLKTRHNDAEIRLTALDCLVAMATQLGASWLPLLAESVPFLAELLEDGDSRIEAATKDAIRKLESILGEPLEKYF